MWSIHAASSAGTGANAEIAGAASLLMGAVIRVMPAVPGASSVMCTVCGWVARARRQQCRHRCQCGECRGC